MRVLQLVDGVGPFGGLERFTHDFTQRLLAEGHQTTVATFTRDERMPWGGSSLQTELLPEEPEAWEAFAARYAPDLVVWHAGHRSAAPASLLARSLPLVATVHGPLCPSEGRLFRDRDEVCTRPSGPACLLYWYARRCGTDASPGVALEGLRRTRRMLRAVARCTRVYAVSESLKRLLVLEGVPSERVRVFDNTLGDVRSPMPPLRVRPGAGPEEPLRPLYVGRLVYAKGVQYFLRAVRALLTAGTRVQATVVGEGWYRGQLEAQSRALGLAPHVRFAGQVPGGDIGAWYARADVVVVPSVWPEPAGLVVPEARRRGTPVVVFDVGGLPEWLGLMDGVFVARAADAVHLAQRMEEACRPAEEGAAVRVLQPAPERVDLIAELSREPLAVAAGSGGHARSR